MSIEFKNGENIFYTDELELINKTIKWRKSIGCNFRILYNGEIYKFKLEEYVQNRIPDVILSCEGQLLNKISTANIKKCKIGSLLGLITSDFKIDIGTVYNDDKRDYTIIKREYKEVNKKTLKCYKYKCNKCGNEDWLIEYSIIKQKTGCNVCCYSGIKKVTEFNCLSTTHPELTIYLKDKNIGKTITKGKHTKVTCVCPDCKHEKDIEVAQLVKQGFACNVCSCGVSYPNRVMGNLLNINNVKFTSEFYPNWSNGKFYDFHFVKNNERYIIEMQGSQHYESGFDTCGGRTLKEEQENDKLKKELALKNGIKEENYIVVDCRVSNMNYISNNILKSKLSEIIDLCNTNWNKIEELCHNNIVKEVSLYRALNPTKTTYEIGEVFNICKSTIRKYLKIGNKLGWCEYNQDEELKRIASINGSKSNTKFKPKPVMILKDGIILDYFESVNKLEKASLSSFGVKLNNRHISVVANGKEPQYKGYTFRYITKEEYEQRKSQTA